MLKIKLPLAEQKGIAHIVLIFILGLGIIAGVYLVRKEGFQLFKPKAAQKSIEILPGDCVKEKDGKKVLECERFQFKLTSPLEEGN